MSRQDRNRRTVEMGLGEIEADIGDAAHQRLQPRLRIGRDEVGELLRLPVGKGLPGFGWGSHRVSFNFPLVSSEVETPRRQALPMGISTSLDANGCKRSSFS